MDKLKSLKLLYLVTDNSPNLSTKKLFEVLFKDIIYTDNTKDAEENYDKLCPDILIVDDNFKELVEYVRKKDLNIPIIVLSNNKDIDNLVEFINLQINGYLMNPISLDDLSCCFDNCVRKIEVNEILIVDKNISYDLRNKELFLLEKPLKIGKKLNTLLYFFLTNKNKVLSKDDIQYKVWDDEIASDSSIKNLIGSLRQIVGKEKIVNLPGIGWKFVI